MRTTIWSRARTALTIFAMFLAVAIVAAAILFAVQRVYPAQSHTYRVYDLEVDPSPPWHPGQSLSLVWVPTVAGMDRGDPPRSVTCQFWLYGPYATRAAAQADQTAMPGNGVTLAASTAPLVLSTDMGSPAPTPVAYTLPDTLAPGYYVAMGSVGAEDQSGPGSTSVWVAEVAA